MNKVIVITGPTAVGKTKLSVELAKKLDGEVINADSMQIYKGLNIGTAKILESEKEGIVHHLFDIKNVDEEYSIYNYQIDARKIIDDIIKRGKTPIMVGGTGLYIKACLYDYKLNENKSRSDFEDMTNEEIYNYLCSKLGNIEIDKNNRRRLVSALNYYNETGKAINENKTDKLLYDTIFIGLTCDRDILYDRINKRVDAMINNGLLDEVKYFYDKNIRTKPLLSGIGYQEIYKYLDGVYDLKTAIEEIKKNSRHYAKRQYTFFNHQLNVKWFSVNFEDFNITINEVMNYISNNDNI